MTVAKILKEAQKLDVNERKLLVRFLVNSIEKELEVEMIEVEPKSELGRRMKALQKDPDNGIEWSVFRKQLRKDLKQLRRKRA